MQHRVSPEALQRASELTEQQGRSSWWVCDEYALRDQEIFAKYYLPPPPWPGEKNVHWRIYEPLEDTPDLFLKLARLDQEPEFEQATLAFIHSYGVLGGKSTEQSNRQPYRDSLSNFRAETKRAWTILKMYEAVLNHDWMAAKTLLCVSEAYGGEGHWPLTDSKDTYLLVAFHEAVHMVARTVQELCRPTLRFTQDHEVPKFDPSSIERAWWFDNLLGAAYLQMYWLMTSSDSIARCEHCGLIISLGRPHPEGRKRRSDKRFCDDACRQAHHRSKKRVQDAPS